MKRQLRKHYLLAFDAIGINISVICAFILRFGFDIPIELWEFYLSIFIIFTIGKLVVLSSFNLYNSLWKFASVEELIQVILSSFISNIFGITYMLMKGSVIPFGCYVNILLLDIVFIGGMRFSYRIIRRLKNHKSITRQDDGWNILIIGAGETGGMIAKEIKNNPDSYGKLKGLIDDDPKKLGKTINGIKVLGNRYDIYSVVKRHNIKEIILSIPGANKKSIKEIANECSKTECTIKTVPTLSEIMDGKVNMTQLRNIDIEDLLGRDAVDLNLDEINHYVNNKVVLITGGGGSIGSEICRQIAKFEPKKLIVLDIYENNAYEIQNELAKKYGRKLDLVTLIASVRDVENINQIFEKYKPNVVFHAAAHKHVPLMETAPREAILNNCFGTLNLAQASDLHRVEKFVLISTDKAVNPTNIMGASKRICEMIVQSIAKTSDTKFSAVRFGNVLGSNGSVIPLFKKQIEEGGPVTVTHKDIIRYFMTIPEAAQLVIQSGSYAKGGEVFILDMGEPVKIYNLAEDLIRLSGFEPHEEIKIEITGLRPGEKLYEELLMNEEGIVKTSNSKIFIGKPSVIDYRVLLGNLENLKKVVLECDDCDIKKSIKRIVPTYRENEEVNNCFEKNIKIG